MSEDIWDEYLKEENAVLWKARYEFLAQLVFEVMRKIEIVKPWKDIAINAVYEYESNRQRYVDDDMSSLLTKTVKGDWWVMARHISSSKGRKKIRVILEAQGWYIANITGQGVLLTDSPKEIKDDFRRNLEMVKSRAITMTKTALRMRETAELPSVMVQARLTGGIVEDA